MLTISLTADVLERAMIGSKKHHSQRGNPYVDVRFPIKRPISLKLEPVDLEELKLDKRAGIYLIWDKSGNSAYVGMTADFSYRFYHGKSNHKTKCIKCTCHGHINATPKTCRSHKIINSENGFNVSIIHEMKYDPELVCQAEVDWYYILICSGIEMVNRDWALGNPSFSGLPIVSCNLSTREYLFFPNQIGASVVCYGETSGGAGYVDVCAKQRQNQQSGYTHRLATEDEIDYYQGVREISEMISQFESDVVWRTNEGGGIIEDMREFCQGCEGSSGNHKRAPRIEWNGGPLSDLDINHLLANGRLSSDDSKYQKNPESDYKGVRWHKRGGWQCGVKTGPRGKDIQQRGPRKSWGNDDSKAALYREGWILKDGLQDFNKDENGSNAELLNHRLTSEQRGGKTFVDWNVVD